MNDEHSIGMTAPPASSLLARAIYAAVRSGDDVKILSLGPHGAALAAAGKTMLVLFSWQEARAGEIRQKLEQLMKEHAAGPLVVGLVGGGDEERRALKSARPMMTRVKVGQVHIDDRGKLWSRDTGSVAKAFRDFERTPHPSDEDWARLVVQSAADRAEHEGSQKEAREFFTALQSRRPVATWTLAGLLVAVFGLEYYFGGTQSPPVLLRMGGLSPEKVASGEWWRLFSCTFLHSGPMHLLFNTYVLYVLGTNLERLLGLWRFLALYGISCLGASLVSMAFLDGFSVGASGGLWGLLGAEAVLAWHSQGLLPQAMIAGARRVAMINLGINVLNSFRPHVDMWAHFGGGAVGAVLMLSGFLTRGVPRLGELEARGRFEGAEAASIRTGPAMKLVGGGAAALLLLGLALGLLQGRPWALTERQPGERIALPEVGVSLTLPAGLERSPGPSNEPESSVEVGDLRSDPGAAVIARYAADLSDPGVLASERASLKEALQQGLEGAVLVAGPEDVTIAGAPGLTVTYRYSNGIEEEMAFVFLADAMIKADVLRWPAFGDAVPAGYAAWVLDSLELLESF